MTLLALASRARDVDGVDPLNEASRLALDAGHAGRVHMAVKEGTTVVAAAFADGLAPVELVVDPDHRRQGHGGTLLTRLLAAGESEFWAHGDLPAAQALAAAKHLEPGRTLLVLRLDMNAAPEPERVPDGVTIRTFEPGDVDAIVQVNRRAFASHPEQGAMDRADFEQRASSDWFDPAGLFVAVRDGEGRDGDIVGFHWTKVDPSTGSGTNPTGEVYVVGVDPSEQGSGLGTSLTARGLRHLHESGIRTVDLYVEGDNDPALAVYRRLGFTEHARDVLYVVS